MKLCVALAVLLLCNSVRASLLIANFDNRNEGAGNTTLTVGQIRFHDYLASPGDSPGSFQIENASDGSLGAPFSTPNVLNFNGFSAGPGFGYGRVSSFQFDVNGTFLVSGDLDLWTSGSATTSIALEGWLGGVMISSTSTTASPSSGSYHHLQLANALFDLFILRSSGSVDSGVSFMVVDNVQVNTVPEPAGLVFAVIPAFLLGRRRRRMT